MSRFFALICVVGVLGVMTSSLGAAQDDTGSVVIESLTPPAGPVGTEIAYALGGTDETGGRECALSSAYRLELLASDGTLAATGGETVTVPDGAGAGEAFVRLVCYVPDATGRRVIHGLCAAFAVTEPDAAAPPGSGSAVDCPPTPRVTLGQSVIAVERAMSEAFNPLLFYPFPK